MESPPIVIDTNIVLDLFVFADEAALPLRRALEQRTWQWLASGEMRAELERVLGYPQIARRLLRTPAGQVMDAFDRNVHIVPAAGKAPTTCGDPDDQKFIDLAVAHRALLLSKDREVLRMKKRLLALGVQAQTALPVSVTAQEPL
ncbi:putative toxin-antitoxin system toxin component, PIN family [Variovorax sp. VNK109]|uniref:putative toxin-antitoxin system toxin component, PIN family n=1 Tax=Variovorax sp. VNK109 TaxID=3400919 RepID=UPI003BFC0749